MPQHQHIHYRGASVGVIEECQLCPAMTSDCRARRGDQRRVNALYWRHEQTSIVQIPSRFLNRNENAATFKRKKEEKGSERRGKKQKKMRKKINVLVFVFSFLEAVAKWNRSQTKKKGKTESEH